MRRLGCLFIGVNMIGTAMFLAVLALAAKALGLLDLPVWRPAQGLLVPGMVVAVILGIALIIGAGMRVRQVSVPLDDLLEAANRAAEGDYTARMVEDGPPEIRSLAETFNSMMARLQANDTQRRNLLADVSHELRTPLTVIQGNLEGMLDGVYPADEARLKSLVEETRLLARLVDDLRTLALAESGALQLRREPTDLAMLLRDTVAGFQSGAPGIRIETALAQDIPLVEVDPTRLREVIVNLLSNAARYTPPGDAVSVRYRQVDAAAVEIEVADRGPGIAAEDLPHVFERFYKSSDSGGMGLGLAIAKHLVEAHGGTIEAVSQPGAGTIVRVRLPAF